MAVFVSYSSGDHAFVQREVVGLLKALRIETWFAPESIRTSEIWEESIRLGVETSDWFVVIVSKGAASSAWVKKEVCLAFEKQAKIIPIVIDDCKPRAVDERLASIQHLDYATHQTQATQELIQLLIDAEFRGLQRSLSGKWMSAVQPVYYSRSRESHSAGAWHIQAVSISPFLNGFVVDTLPEKDKLQWRWHAELVANSFLVGEWKSKRKSSTSHGFMSVNLARNGTYMYGHDYAVVLEEAKAHYGVLLLGRDRGALETAWSAMQVAKRDLADLDSTIDFPLDSKESNGDN